jgi:hypothetical protein
MNNSDIPHIDPEDMSPVEIQKKVREYMISDTAKKCVVDYVYAKRRDKTVELEGFIESWVKAKVHNPNALVGDVMKKVMELMTVMMRNKRVRDK